jgi:hypothetical protein
MAGRRDDESDRGDEEKETEAAAGAAMIAI